MMAMTWEKSSVQAKRFTVTFPLKLSVTSHLQSQMAQNKLQTKHMGAFCSLVLWKIVMFCVHFSVTTFTNIN